MQEAAIVDLRDLLLRATLYFFSRNPDDFRGTNHDELLQRAEDSAQEALIAVMSCSYVPPWSQWTATGTLDRWARECIAGIRSVVMCATSSGWIPSTAIAKVVTRPVISGTP